MTTQPETSAAEQSTAPDRSVRPVIEHALTAYGYQADTARTLIDRLITEGKTE
jgi:hypothetical protein